MRKRTLAREYALQVLYKLDITHDKDPEVVLANFWLMGVEEEVEESVKVFAAELVKGVLSNLESIDKDISQYATNWKLERMAVVDRNILRLSAYELLFKEDIPPKVSINEAVELAKKYSEPKSAKFVNGVLDKIKLEKNK
jgi:transcription antitermination factor NusB